MTVPSPGLQDLQAQRSAARLAAVGVGSGLKDEVHDQASGWRLGGMRMRGEGGGEQEAPPPGRSPRTPSRGRGGEG